MDLWYKAEYAKSGRASCHGCKFSIGKDDLRLAEIVQSAYHDGKIPQWYHCACFFLNHTVHTTDEIENFESLRWEDQENIRNKIRSTKNKGKGKKRKTFYDLITDNSDKENEMKKLKSEDEVDNDSFKMKQEQNESFYTYRDQLKQNLNKKELKFLLEINEQEIPRGVDKILDHLADIMTFGTLLRCSECKVGQLLFNKGTYMCQNDLTEWSKCNKTIKKPERVRFAIPDELSQKYPFLKNYKYVERTRIVNDVDSTNNDKANYRTQLPLDRMQFMILGNMDKEHIEKEIVKLGGKVVSSVSDSLMAVISDKEEVEKMNDLMSDVKDVGVQVVSKDFLFDVTEFDAVPELVIKRSICSWRSDPSSRLPAKSSYTFAKNKSSEVTLKDSNAVDPDSGLANTAHVYHENLDIYCVVLGITDIQQQKNSYYKLQLLEADCGKTYWVFRSWGRIGTIIGDNKLEKMHSLEEAKNHFEDLYEKKSGNSWGMRDDFVKYPDKKYPIDIDYCEDKSNIKTNYDVPSKLPTEVQQLMKLIFNIDSMNKIILKFDLDIEKMPLGVLSKHQLKKAYTVLSELQELIKDNEPEARIIDASNRFYTYIPHAVGIDQLPLLNNDIISLLSVWFIGWSSIENCNGV